MKRFSKVAVLSAVALGAFCALAFQPRYVTFQVAAAASSASSNGITGSPTAATVVCYAGSALPAGCTQGIISLRRATGYRLTVCDTSGGTLAGAGVVQVQYCPQTNAALCSGLWPRILAQDQTVTVTATSCRSAGATVPCRCQTFADIQTGSMGDGDGWLGFSFSGITTSGATDNVTLQAEVFGNQ